MLYNEYLLADNERDVDNPQSDVGGLSEDESVPHFTEQVKKLRERSAEIIEDKKAAESSSLERETDTGTKNKVDRKIATGRGSVNFLTRRPIVVVVIIIGIVILGVALYTAVQFGNESYKIEKFNSQWNSSLSDLRSGNVSITDYCNTRVHDQKLCDQFWNLKYMS